jgi:hypothetical protein
MSLDRLLLDKPQLHVWSDGRPASWAVSPGVLRWMHAQLKPGMRTLETGSGHTTVMFAIAGTQHTCITPSHAEGEAITRYCHSIGVSTDGLRFVYQPSDVALAAPGVLPESLDFVFIDGAHRFPLPHIDFHYTEPRIKVGGILGVDDCGMPSVRQLHDFLDGEDEWVRDHALGSTVFFRRIAETKIVSDWKGQRMNAAFLHAPATPGARLRRMVSRLSSAVRPH